MTPLDISSNALANAIGVSAARVNEIAKGKRGITADTAIRLSRYFGTTPDLWLNLQMRFELQTAMQAIGNGIERIHPRAA